MRVTFAEDALRDPESWSHLDHILHAVEAGLHEWEIDDPDTLDQSPWLQGSNRPSLRKLFEQATVRGAYPSVDRLHRRLWVVSMKAAQGALTPKVAAIFFNRPLAVLVENRFTDGLFLETVLAFLAPKPLRDFLDQCEGEPFRCDSGGGSGELPKLIAAHVEEMATQGVPTRAVVFADSDARYPTDVSQGARKIAETCAKHAIGCLILSKRAIENYIPDEPLRRWVAEPANRQLAPRVEAVCRLTAEQRDHLAMKKPYPPRINEAKERQLFASVPEADVQIMRKHDAFDNTLIDVLRSHRHCLSAEALRRRDGSGELDRLVAMIAQAL